MRLKWPPERYADCIGGIVTGMLTGQPHGSTRAFGTVRCHLVHDLVNGTVIAKAGCACRDVHVQPPNLTLAKLRIEEGFAFAGLVEQWPLSMCLFALKFGVHCRPTLMLNSRPSKISATYDKHHPAMPLNRTLPNVYHTPSLYNIFADSALDGALYEFVRRRFEDELRSLNVTSTRCAKEICPEAAKHFVDASVSE